MKTRIYFLLPIFSLAFFYSCTVDKRQYRPGYHVDFLNPGKQKFASTSEKELKEEQIVTSQLEEKPLIADASGELTEEVARSVQPEYYKEMVSDTLKSKKGAKKKKEVAAKSIDDEKIGTTEKVTHWGAIVGLVMSLTGFFLFGLIFGGIALGDIKKYPDKYKGKKMAIAAVAISAGILFAIFILLALIV